MRRQTYCADPLCRQEGNHVQGHKMCRWATQTPMTNPQPDEIEREIMASDYAYLLSVAKDLGYSAVLNALEDLSRLREQVERPQGSYFKAMTEATAELARLREQIAAQDAALKEAKDELVRLRDRYGTAHSEVVISRISAALTNTTEGGE